MLKSLKNLLQAEIDPAFALRAKIILENIEKIKPQKILDAGCGRGFYINALTYFKFIKEIHGADINNKYLNIAKKNIADKRVRIIKTNLYSLPYPDNYFDFIIASEILEHLTDDKKALLELKRVLKKNGTLIITVPNRNFPFFWDPINWLLMKVFNTHINKNIWWLAGIWADHERLYSKEQIKKLLINNGFKIKSVNNILHWCWPFSHFLLYGIGKNLIERFGLNSFSRFNFEKDKRLSCLMAAFFSAPSNLLDSWLKTNPSTGIIIKAKKRKRL